MLLLLDGYSSHTKSIELLRLAMENNITLLCFPLHRTHRLQQLNVFFVAPVSVYYEQKVGKFVIHHPEKAVTIYKMAKLFGTSFFRAAKGFSDTGRTGKLKYIHLIGISFLITYLHC